MKLKAFFFVSALFLQSGCAILSYDVEPKQAWQASSLAAHKSKIKLSYFVEETVKGISFGGMREVARIIKKSSLFESLDRVDQFSQEGYFLHVKVENVRGSPIAWGWGYVAATLLFILPAYTDTSGFDVYFEVYKNGKQVKEYQYEIQRTGFAWLPVLPFAWINLLTSSEADAFQAITKQFLIDANADQVFN